MQLPKLNEKEKLSLRLQIEAEIYKRSLYEFFVASSKILYPQVDWDYNWHFKYLCDEVLQPEIERIQRKEAKTHDIIVNTIFRSGKSILLSQIFPVWIWVRDASASVMQVSHSETLAIKHSHASKMLVESEWFQERFPDIKLRLDTHSKNNYMTTAGGKRISFGIKSGIIGEGVDYVQIIDDINSPSDSQAVTQSINEIYSDTLYSRLNNDYAIRLILQQRVAENDICGYLLNKNPTKYFHVCLPAKLSTKISPVHLAQYYTNGLLWENRFSEAKLLDFQQTLGSRAYAGQLQQSPVAEEGNIIKRAWIKTITLSDWLKLTQNQAGIDVNLYVDTAYTSKQTNDATAILAACAFNSNVYVIKAWKVWEEFPELIKTLKRIKLQTNARIVFVESKASGLSVLSQLRRDGFDCQDLNPKDKDKVSRMNTVAARIEGGHFWMVDDGSGYIEMVLTDLTSFPYGADDIPDVVVYSIENLLNKNSFNYAM